MRIARLPNGETVEVANHQLYVDFKYSDKREPQVVKIYTEPAPPTLAASTLLPEEATPSDRIDWVINNLRASTCSFCIEQLKLVRETMP